MPTLHQGYQGHQDARRTLPRGYFRSQQSVPIAGRMVSGSSSIQWNAGRMASGSSYMSMGPPLGYARGPIQAHAERALAGRYHQLLLQGRARYMHGPGMLCGPIMNYAPVLPVSMAPTSSYGPPTVVHHHYYGGGYCGPAGDGGADFGGPPADDWQGEEMDNDAGYDDGYDDGALDFDGEEADDNEFDFIDGYEEDRPKPRPTPDPPKRRVTGLHPDTPTMLAKFLRTFDCADKDDPEHRRLREALFLSFDSNHNGYISLAEVGGGVMLELSKTCGREAMPVYHRVRVAFGRHMCMRIHTYMYMQVYLRVRVAFGRLPWWRLVGHLGGSRAQRLLACHHPRPLCCPARSFTARTSARSGTPRTARLLGRACRRTTTT